MSTQKTLGCLSFKWSKKCIGEVALPTEALRIEKRACQGFAYVTVTLSVIYCLFGPFRIFSNKNQVKFYIYISHAKFFINDWTPQKMKKGVSENAILCQDFIDCIYNFRYMAWNNFDNFYMNSVFNCQMQTK